MRCSGVNFQLRIPNELSPDTGSHIDGNYLVVIAVHDQSRNMDLLEILGLIRFRESSYAIVKILQAGLHALQPERIAYSFEIDDPARLAPKKGVVKS